MLRRAAFGGSPSRRAAKVTTGLPDRVEAVSRLQARIDSPDRGPSKATMAGAVKCCV